MTRKTVTEIDVFSNVDAISDKVGDSLDGVLDKISSMDFNLFGIDFSGKPDFFGVINVLWLIPLLAMLTAYLSSYVTRRMQAMPQTEQQQSSMKTMSLIMPLMSAVFCFMLPAGVGLYWIMSNVFQIAQTIFLTKIFSKNNEEEVIDAEEYFSKNRVHRKKH